eukprot:2789397-Rhodomonas_salina.1
MNTPAVTVHRCARLCRCSNLSKHSEFNFTTSSTSTTTTPGVSGIGFEVRFEVRREAREIASHPNSKFVSGEQGNSAVNFQDLV